MRLKKLLTNRWVHVYPDLVSRWSTAQNMKLSIKDFFSKCDQTGRKLRVWSDLLKKSLMENFIFCTVEEEEVAGLLESLLVCR